MIHGVGPMHSALVCMTSVSPSVSLFTTTTTSLPSLYNKPGKWYLPQCPSPNPNNPTNQPDRLVLPATPDQLRRSSLRPHLPRRHNRLRPHRLGPLDRRRPLRRRAVPRRLRAPAQRPVLRRGAGPAGVGRAQRELDPARDQDAQGRAYWAESARWVWDCCVWVGF